MTMHVLETLQGCFIHTMDLECLGLQLNFLQEISSWAKQLSLSYGRAPLNMTWVRLFLASSVHLPMRSRRQEWEAVFQATLLAVIGSLSLSLLPHLAWFLTKLNSGSTHQISTASWTMLVEADPPAGPFCLSWQVLTVQGSLCVGRKGCCFTQPLADGSVNQSSLVMSSHRFNSCWWTASSC